MTLKERFRKTGNWFFRWRSYLPLVLIVLFLIALRYSEHPYNSSHGLDQLWEIFCLFVSFLGLGIRVFTVGFVPERTSGRNTKKQVAKTLNTTGMYSIVRHPLYLGNFFILLGVSLFVRLWWFSLITMLIFWLYYEKIMFAEEEFLREKFGELYLRWAEQVPAFFPKFKDWQPPSLPFSFRNVLKREYPTFFATIASFTFLEIVGTVFAENKFELDLVWLTLFVIGLIVYITLRILKKKTKILDVEGR